MPRDLLACDVFYEFLSTWYRMSDEGTYEIWQTVRLWRRGLGATVVESHYVYPPASYAFTGFKDA